MVLKSQLDELIETLTDYTTYLKQFGYDADTIFCAYAVVAMHLTGEKSTSNIGRSIMKKVKSINVVDSINHTIH
jgi:hypothetical protein